MPGDVESSEFIQLNVQLEEPLAGPAAWAPNVMITRDGVGVAELPAPDRYRCHGQYVKHHHQSGGKSRGDISFHGERLEDLYVEFTRADTDEEQRVVHRSSAEDIATFRSESERARRK